MIYRKSLQNNGRYKYYKIDSGREPIGVEVISFSSYLPHVSYEEYNWNDDFDTAKIESIIRSYEGSSQDEFLKAYRQATNGDFKVC